MDVSSRYLIGIDLGTTNSAVAYVNTQETPVDTENLIRNIMGDFATFNVTVTSRCNGGQIDFDEGHVA